MQLYIQDRTGDTVGTIGNIYDDVHTMVLSSGVSNYEFSYDKNQPDAGLLVAGNYVVLVDENGAGWKFTIVQVEETHTEVHVTAEDLGLELLNKQRAPIVAPTKAQSFVYYFKQAVADTGWELGINECANMTRTLKWEGWDTALARLLSVCTEFDHAEIEFKIEWRNLSVQHKVVNVYKRRGNVEPITQLVYGDTVSDITKTSDMYSFVTAMEGVGSALDGDADKHVTFADQQYDDGDFFSPKGDSKLYARTANRQFNITDTYIEGYYEYDTQDAKELLRRTLTQLKAASTVAVNYEVALATVDAILGLGDTVTIIDHDYQPELLLEARALEIRRSYTDRSKDAVVFGNYRVMDNGINDRLAALEDRVRQMKVAQFRPWVRYADDDQGSGMSALAVGKQYMAIVWSQDATPSDDPADYAGKWVLIKGADGAAGQAGPPGADGKTPYVHTAYADSVDGKIGFSTTAGDGKSYLGQYTNYVAADSTDPAKYNWVRFKGDQGAQGVPGTPGSKDVPMTYVQADQPTGTIVTNSVWWVGASQAAATQLKRWDGSQWVDESIAQAVLNIKELNAISIKGSTITGSTVQTVGADNGQVLDSQGLTVWKRTTLTDSTAANMVTKIDHVNARVTTGLYYDGSTQFDPSSDRMPDVYAQLDPFNQDLIFSNSVGTAALDYETAKQLNVIGQRLWSGVSTMNGNQSITPSLALHDCLHGWVALWSAFNGKTQTGENQRFWFEYIPKWFANAYPGKGITAYVDAPGGKGSNNLAPATKYLYVADTTLKGYAGNGVGNGAQYVMREVRAY